MADIFTHVSNKLSPPKSRKSVITKSIYIKSVHALSQLKKCREEHLGRSRELSTTDSKHEDFRCALRVESVDITRTILDHLVPVLHSPPSNLPTEDEEDDKWYVVDFCDCFYSPHRCGRDECSDPYLNFTGVRYFGPGPFPCSCRHHYFKQRGHLGNVLAHRTKSLALRESPDILSCLLAISELETPRFVLYQSMLSASDCERLGILVQRSCHLKNLTLHLTKVEDPQILAESMGNAIHLQELTIEDKSKRPTTHQERQQRPTLADSFVKQGGNDMVGRLLQNTQSCLKMLYLHSMQLDDCHFMVIVDALPTSQLEVLDVSNNNIQCQGILSFAAQLCTNKTLTRVRLICNPWEDDWEELEKCWTALQQGLAENYSMHYLGARDRSPLKEVADYYCRLNRAGRQILSTSDMVPLGLWPLILQRAGKDKDNYLRSGDSVLLFLQSNHILAHLCSVSSLSHNSHEEYSWCEETSWCVWDIEKT